MFPGLLMALFLLLAARPAQADEVTMALPTFKNGQHVYFHDLLRQSLAATGHTLTITPIKDYPFKRIMHMLETGQITGMYLVHSTDRDRRFEPVEIGLTNGLIGKRILLVPEDETATYQNVRTLEDFRNLGRVAGLGESWFDVNIWRSNKLAVKTLADWTLIYEMVLFKDRGIHYFPRGFVEILGEHELHPDLAIEPHLMLVYDRDFFFYLSPHHKHLTPIIRKALAHARDSGLMDRLLRTHFKRSFEVLQPEKRRIIPIKLPPRL